MLKRQSSGKGGEPKVIDLSPIDAARAPGDFDPAVMYVLNSTTKSRVVDEDGDFSSCETTRTKMFEPTMAPLWLVSSQRHLGEGCTYQQRFSVVDPLPLTQA